METQNHMRVKTHAAGSFQGFEGSESGTQTLVCGEHVMLPGSSINYINTVHFVLVFKYDKNTPVKNIIGYIYVMSEKIDLLC